MLRISGAIVVDGTGAPGAARDVVIDGDRIVEVSATHGDDVAAERTDAATEVIDGSGLVLAPGFVDVHTHDDAAVLASPDHACKTLQGVTSIVVGNCGISAAPASDHTRGITEYARLADYFAEVESTGVAVNVASLLGHGAARAAVIGLRTDRAPDAAERSALLDHVAAALDDGAVGLSSGLAYEPGRYAALDELVDCARLVADASGVYATHMRDEGDGLLDSIDESLAVAEATGVRLQISHLKAAGRRNWGAVVEALRRIDAARAAGVDVMADQYPYTRGSTVLEQVVRAGALQGPSPFGHLDAAQILVAAAPRHREWEGRTVAEIAGEHSVDGTTMAERIVDAEGRACIVVLDMMSEDDVRTVLRHPAVMVGSDGVPGGDRPHPRLHHTYPRVLGHYARDEHLLDLPEAVRRMTSLPADRFGFTDRGRIRPGAFADLVLFDPATIADTGTYADPTAVPAGIDGVWVNGRRIVADGAVTGERPGRVLRR